MESIFKVPTMDLWSLKIWVGWGRPVVCLEAISSFQSEVVAHCLNIWFIIFRHTNKPKSSHCTYGVSFLNGEARCIWESKAYIINWWTVRCSLKYENFIADIACWRIALRDGFVGDMSFEQLSDVWCRNTLERCCYLWENWRGEFEWHKEKCIMHIKLVKMKGSC